MEFSVTETSLAGFKLIGRRPLSFLVWALVWILFGYGGLGLLMMWAAPNLQGLLGSFPQPDGDPRQMAMAMLQFEMGVVRVVWPWALWVWLMSVVLTAAIFRAVLEPRRRGLAYLRIGGDELRLAVLWIVLYVLTVIYFIALGLACAAAIAALSHLQQPWNGIAIAAVGIAAICLTIILAVRLGVAAPMTFARKRLQIFDSWGVTRGRFWKLVGVILMLMILLIAIGIAFGLIRNVLAMGQMQEMMRDAFEHPGDPGRILNRVFQMMNPRTLSPTIAALLIVQGLADTLMRVVAAAPFAESYRLLTTRPEAPAAPAAPSGAALTLGPEPDSHAHSPPAAHDDHGHADPHAHSDGHGDHAHGDDHGHADPHAHGDDHGHGDGDGHEGDHGHHGH